MIEIPRKNIKLHSNLVFDDVDLGNVRKLNSNLFEFSSRNCRTCIDISNDFYQAFRDSHSCSWFDQLIFSLNFQQKFLTH